MRSIQLGLLASLIVSGVISFTQPASAANWPRFRGPNGTGIANDKDIPVQWTEKDGVLWKATLPGEGNSSPIIWGNRIFLQSATPDGKERYLLCLTTTDGKILWKESVPGGRAKVNKKNSLASSTPAADGERVYAMFWDGRDITLYGYDFEGKQLWKYPLGSFTSQHGAAASPVVYGDKVYFYKDQDDNTAILVALEAKTGKFAWQAKRQGFRACYSAPFLLDKADEGPELIVASTAGVTAYNPKTGAENWNWTWSFSGMPLRTVSSPIASHGLIYATSGDGSGARHMVAVKAGGKGDVTKTNLAWEYKDTFPYVPSLLSWGDHVYWVNDQGIAGCNVAQTGKSVWNERLGGTMSASPVLIDGKVYAVNEAGDVYVFAAAPTFKLLAKNALGEPVFATPAVADNRLYIRSKNHLFCIGKSDKK